MEDPYEFDLSCASRIIKQIEKLLDDENETDSRYRPVTFDIVKNGKDQNVAVNQSHNSKVTSRNGKIRGQQSPSNKQVNSLFCAFCKSNGEPRSFYISHGLRTTNGKVSCPVLYVYVCPICGATGENSHTLRYCPLNTSDSLSITCITKSIRSAAGLRTKNSKHPTNEHSA